MILNVVEKPAQNASQLAKSPLAACSVADLKQMLHQHHAAFGGCLRKGIKEHALQAGRALVELSRRHKHGQWGAWLAENFQGSPQTARVYMQLAEGWEQIEAAGLDSADVTLEMLRKFLTKPKNAGKNPKQSAPELKLPAGAAASPPDVRDFVITLPVQDLAELKKMLDFLLAKFKTANEAETIVAAVRRCCEEHDANN